MSGSRSKGWSAHGMVTYTNNYVLGSNGESPYAYMLMTSSITFGGFSPNYPTVLRGLLVFKQDAVGGRDVNWNGKLTFIGSSGMNLAANAITVYEVVNTPAGWLGHKWS